MVNVPPAVVAVVEHPNTGLLGLRFPSDQSARIWAERHGCRIVELAAAVPLIEAENRINGHTPIQETA